MTAQPDWFVAEFDEDRRLRLSDDEAARLSVRLGHEPQPGDRVRLVLVDDGLPPEHEADLERWLRSEAVASLTDMRAHPELSKTSDQLREHFAARLAAVQTPDSAADNR